MADQAINALPIKTAPTTGDKMLMIGAAEEYQIDYDQLATAILNKLTSKTFTLDQGTKSLVAALNELNSNMTNRNYLDKTDLNEVPIPSINGLYVWRAQNTCLNTPKAAHGLLEVMKIDSDNFQIQRYTTLESVPRIFTRCKINGIWYGWSEV